MEPEEMKQRWEELSRRLDRQQIISRTLLESAVSQRRRNAAAFTRFNLVSTAAAFPVCIGIALWRGLLGMKFLWVGMAGLAVVMLFEIRKTGLMNRMNKGEADIAAQERLANCYRRTQLYAYLFSNLFTILYIGWMVLTKWDAFGIPRAGLVLGIMAAAILFGAWLFRREADAIRELRRAEGDLREFRRE